MPEETTYRLEVEALELGPETRAVGVELIESGTREPLTGPEAAKIWAAALSALAGGEPWVLDFFAHLERVRDFCAGRQIEVRNANPHVLIIPELPLEQLEAVIGRFTGERFGLRAGGPGIPGDPELEAELVARGVDAYQNAYHACLFCAVCDFDDGFLTLLSDRIWPSEVIRRARPALGDMPVEVTRPS